MRRFTVLSLLVLSGSAAWAAPAGPPPLSHEEIKEVVDSHIADLKTCMGQHGGATGKLVVEFGILPNGKVTDQKPKERSSNAAPLAASCATCTGAFDRASIITSTMPAYATLSCFDGSMPPTVIACA